MTDYKSILKKHRMTMIKIIGSLVIWIGGAVIVFWYSNWQILIGIILMTWANNISINHRIDNLK